MPPSTAVEVFDVRGREAIRHALDIENLNGYLNLHERPGVDHATAIQRT